MDIDTLQRALAIVNKNREGGKVEADYQEIDLLPDADRFTAEEVAELKALGFVETDYGTFNWHLNRPRPAQPL